MAEPETESAFLDTYKSPLRGALRWHQLDALWERVRARAGDGWYVYAVGEPPPEEPASAATIDEFIQEVDALLRREHEEDYCGTVYADDFEAPRLVKIYDPNNLGVVCGYSDNPPLPGWVISLDPPVDLPQAMTPPNNRRRWWRRLFSNGS